MYICKRLQYCNDYKFILIMNLAVHQYLQKFNIKPSVQRMAIMEFLMKHHIHPTADDIYNALYKVIPTLSKTTVYNTLKLFAEQDAVQVLTLDEKNVRFDIDMSSHAHFQCIQCGKVFDIPLEDPYILRLKEIGNLKVLESHLYYKGYCNECKEKEKRWE